MAGATFTLIPTKNRNFPPSVAAFYHIYGRRLSRRQAGDRRFPIQPRVFPIWRECVEDGFLRGTGEGSRFLFGYATDFRAGIFRDCVGGFRVEGFSNQLGNNALYGQYGCVRSCAKYRIHVPFGVGGHHAFLVYDRSIWDFALAGTGSFSA